MRREETGRGQTGHGKCYDYDDRSPGETDCRKDHPGEAAEGESTVRGRKSTAQHNAARESKRPFTDEGPRQDKPSD